MNRATTVVAALSALVGACADRPPAASPRSAAGTAPVKGAPPSPSTVRRCRPPRVPPPVAAPQRNLYTVETISKAVKKATMKGICRDLRAFEIGRATVHFAPDAKVQRMFPRAHETIVRSELTLGTLVRPADPGCFGSGKDFVGDMRQLVGGWRRVDRCFFKPFRIIASKRGPARAQVELHFWLGGIARDGARISEKGVVSSWMRRDTKGHWRFTRLEYQPRERFRSRGLAFADWTERAALPTQWRDRGYPPGDMDHGQILFGGVSIGDFDRDGWPDLYLSRTGRNLLLRGDGSGRFVDVSRKAGVDDPGNSQAAIFADFDNDGDPDLFVVNAYYSAVEDEYSKRSHTLYRNRGDGTFQKMPHRFGRPGPASGAAVADYDGDGRLDIYVTYYQDDDLRGGYHHYIEANDGAPNRLYRNLGGLRFEEVAREAGVANRGWSFAAAWGDYDDDGRLDLYVANDFGDNTLYRNLGDGRFQDVTAGAGVVDSANGMSADWGDYDNDGRLDLYIANMYSKTGNQVLPLYPDLDAVLRKKFLFSVQGNSLYRNLGGGRFVETGRRLGVSLAGWAWGSNFFDYDNDGWLDLHVANGFWAGEVDDDF